LIVIVGAGMSGLFLGSLLKKNYVILEHNDEIGKKIKISGGGKCNITNKFLSPKNYDGDERFISEAFKKFDNRDLLNWLEKNSIIPKLMKKNQYFLNSSEEILNFFKKNVKNVKLGTKVIDIDENLNVKTDRGVIKAQKVVVATGGLSYKKLGASSFGYEIAEKFNHTLKPLKPALVGFTVQPSESWFKKLSGISVFSEVRVGNYIYKDNVLFSHRGITGPAILNASLRWEKGKIVIDFLEKNVLYYLKNPNKQISTQLPLPKRFVKEFLLAHNIKDKKVKYLTLEEKQRLLKLNAYEFAPAGTFGFERAEVTKGGVATNELGYDLQSKIVKNLYFAGEVVDVTGELGGYNFQWAVSSAFSIYSSLV